MQNIENGSLLIAHPTMLDDTFFKGLILITHHNYEESIGIVINKPSKIKLHEIINDIYLEKTNFTFHYPIIMF